jgi:hypothetical protein
MPDYNNTILEQDRKGVVSNIDTMTNDVENPVLVAVGETPTNIPLAVQISDSDNHVSIKETFTTMMNTANPVDGTTTVNSSESSAILHTAAVYPFSNTVDTKTTTSVENTPNSSAESVSNNRSSVTGANRISLRLSSVFGTPVTNNENDVNDRALPIDSYEYERMSVRPNLPQALSKSQQLYIQSQRSIMVQSSYRNASGQSSDMMLLNDSFGNGNDNSFSQLGIGVDTSGSMDFDNKSDSVANESKSDHLGNVSAHGQPKYKHRNIFFPRKIKERVHHASLDVGRREDKALFKLKILFVLLLVIAAIVAGVVVFNYLKRYEQNEFRSNFEYLSKEIKDKVQYNVQSKLEAINSLAHTIQSFAINTNQTWPFVTVPFFEEHVVGMKTLTDAYGVQLFPVIKNSTMRQLWEEYVVTRNDWINTSYLTQQKIYGRSNRRPVLDASKNVTTWFDALWGPKYRISPTSSMNFNRTEPKVNPDFEIGNGMSKQIMTTFHPDNKTEASPYIDLNSNGPYFPQWQAAPMSWYYQTTINSNYGNFKDFNNCTQITMMHKAACLGEAWTDSNAPGYITTLMYPIFDKFRTQNANTSIITASGSELLPASAGFLDGEDGDIDSFIGDDNMGTTTDSKANVIAVLGVDIFWESYLKNLLPNTAKSIYVVVNSSCDQTFTFRINGTDTIVIKVDGKIQGDFHEKGYEDYRQSIRFGQNVYKNSIRNNVTNFATSTYLGHELYDGFCQYDFNIYPSRELKDEYVTRTPVTSTCIVVFIFVFTIVVFIGYDYLVERRQRLVMRTAVLSDTIVSSLFPSNVKQRLYNEADERDKKESRRLTNSSHQVIKISGLQQTNTTKRAENMSISGTSSGANASQQNQSKTTGGSVAGVTSTAPLKGGSEHHIFDDHTDPTLTTTSANESISLKNNEHGNSLFNFEDDVDEDDDVTEFLMTMKAPKKDTMNTSSTVTSTTKSQPDLEEEDDVLPLHRQSFVSAASGSGSSINANGLELNNAKSPSGISKKKLGINALVSPGSEGSQISNLCKKSNLSHLLASKRTTGASTTVLSQTTGDSNTTSVVGRDIAGITNSSQEMAAVLSKIGGRAMIAEEYPHTTVLFAGTI